MKIVIDNLKKTFGETVAVNISHYEIESGMMLGLVGNNGAGKSTLFRLMLDLVKADTGSVCVEGIDVSQTEEWKQWTGAFIDDSFLIDYLTPDEYFQFIANICGISDEDLHNELARYEHFMAGEVTGRQTYIRNLSAGNKQKVGIVAALLQRPQVLILDEPFNFLDPSSQNVMKNLLREYNQQTGATVIISSHNLHHTVDICRHIALIEKGAIIRSLPNADGSAASALEEYFNRP